MNEAKEVILERIRKALGNVPESEKPEDVSVSRAYRQKGELTGDEVVDLFAERVSEYKATVRRIRKDFIKDAVDQACKTQNARHLVVPPGFPEQWLPDDIQPLFDTKKKPLTHNELDNSDGVITTCALAVAQTGTLILDAGPGQGRRALTLLPDYHLCVIREDQIVELLPEAIRELSEKVASKGLPITFISGPSATSDIELNRVEGVHGPRRLDVLVVGP